MALALSHMASQQNIWLRFHSDSNHTLPKLRGTVHVSLLLCLLRSRHIVCLWLEV